MALHVNLQESSHTIRIVLEHCGSSIYMKCNTLLPSPPWVVHLTCGTRPCVQRCRLNSVVAHTQGQSIVSAVWEMTCFIVLVLEKFLVIGFKAEKLQFKKQFS